MKIRRVIVDTNVLFEGLTRQGGAAGLVVEAWLAGLFLPFVSNALAYEYLDVFSRKLTAKRWSEIKPVLGMLLAKSEFVRIYFRWRPISPDRADEHIVDLAMNAGALIVTNNTRDFKLAEKSLGVRVMTPVEFVLDLARSRV
jgi:predicted nucleic acid-binding protein